MAEAKDNPAAGDNRDGYQNGDRGGGGGEDQKEQPNFKEVGKSSAKEKIQKVAFYGNLSCITTNTKF